ncbi:YfjP family GTPase [Streptomyces synnematoformans]|uniref:YfjP family GTPase n=1 Tax=Streptomyces synnematoformans TaxID=415721 RepID=UPI003CD07454
MPAPVGMWDDGLIARRAARWGVRRVRRRAEPAEGAAEAAGSGAEPEGEAADVSGGAVATAAEETGVEEPPRASEPEPESQQEQEQEQEQESGPEPEPDREASPADGVDAGCAGEVAGAAGADGGRREGGVAEMGADDGTDVAAAEPADGGGPGGGSDGAGPVDDGGLTGGGAAGGAGSGAEVTDGGSADGTGDSESKRLLSAWSQEPGAGAGDGDLADAGERGDAYDGDGAAGQGPGGAHADYGADAGMPGGFVPRAEGPLRGRLDALRELVGLSRTRLDGRTLAEAGRVLDEAADRQRLSLDHAVVAIAGATGSGKSSLFNALAGTPLSEVGVRRPTTSQPAACAWRGAGDHAPTLLLERLGLPPRAARPLRDDLGLRGLVLVDLPDHDSAVDEHRARVEQLLRRVDAVIWVVDPEKYADAALHERYLQPLAGYAEVMFVVLNQVDRLPAHAVGQVLDDLRRLLDEDGVALGEHGEPGACVLALSALTGEGVADLRAELVSFIAERRAAERRLTADVDGATARLLDVYVGEGGGGGLDERIRAEFEDRLAEAVGAAATGQAAEQRWLREAEEACGARLAQLWRRRRAARAAGGSADPAGAGGPGGSSGSSGSGGSGGSGDGAADGASAGVGALMPEPRSGEQELVPARAVVEQAVRTVAEEAGAGLPAPWAKAVREAGVRGAEGLADGLMRTAPGGAAGAGEPGADAGAPDGGEPGAGEAAAGESGGDEAPAGGTGAGGGAGATRPGGVPRPRWWSAVGAVQSGLLG